MPRQVLIEGFTESDILALSPSEIDTLVFADQPIVFQAGSATILGEFRVTGQTLTIELAQIEGGGEGVLLMLGALARRFAQIRGLTQVEWIVHAIRCARPNLKLQRVLARRGFVAEEKNGITAYTLTDTLETVE